MSLYPTDHELMSSFKAQIKFKDLELAVANEVIAQLRKELADKDVLIKFARKIISQECWGITLDGCEIQDFAESLGLIAPHIATEADVGEEDDFEVGDRIYKFTEKLKTERKVE